MNKIRRLLESLLLLGAIAWQPHVLAQTTPAPASTAAPASAPASAAVRAAAPAPAANAYTKEGADTCLGCHDDETPTYSASAIFKTRHAARGDKRSPFGMGGLQCEACHGPGAAHARSKKAAAINTFKPDSGWTLEQRNEACLACHSGVSRTGWHAGAHERAHLACTDCHKIHRERDPVLVKANEPQVCAACHKQQRAEFMKPSAHPVRQGRMACSDCHAAHGSAADAMLVKPTINQTCNSCHTDKRGPVLWEHAPVAENCALCHNPHGSVRQALLVKNTPQLCQQCHSIAGHPSVPRTGQTLPENGGGTGAIFLVNGSCTNCHTQVHGSNHPSGAKLMR